MKKGAQDFLPIERLLILGSSRDKIRATLWSIVNTEDKVPQFWGLAGNCQGKMMSSCKYYLFTNSK
jgi:hypothetical protein